MNDRENGLAPDLSLILPVHQQADHIASVVQSFDSAMEALGASYEIILVPNGCTDGSDQVCKELASSSKHVLTRLLYESGWGRAVRAGLDAAHGRMLAYTNSARTQPDGLCSILTVALANRRCVTKALRYQRDSPMRCIGSRLYNFECDVLMGTASLDINGTPKVFPREFARLSSLEQNDDLIDLEFMWLCRTFGYDIIEVPIVEKRRHGGRSSTGLLTAAQLYAGALRFWAERRNYRAL